MDSEVNECVTLAKAQLNVARAKLAGEITNYPTPIAGCDCQFNHLLAELSRVNAALAALEQPRHTPSPKQL